MKNLKQLQNLKLVSKDQLYCKTCKRKIEECPYNGVHPLNG
jgi:hypothetical protein